MSGDRNWTLSSNEKSTLYSPYAWGSKWTPHVPTLRLDDTPHTRGVRKQTYGFVIRDGGDTPHIIGVRNFVDPMMEAIVTYTPHTRGV